MRPIYFTVADSFFESSIMQEELPVRFVMFALIRLAQRSGADGVVDVDLRTFAGSINIPVADVERAIKRLSEPDPASGSPDERGRRIVPVDPKRPMRGWRLVTFQKNRSMVHDANAAARMRGLREERSGDVPASVPVVPVVPDVPPVPTRRDETKTKKKERGAPRPLSVFVAPSVEEVRQEIAEKGFTFTAERFVAVNEQKSWEGVRDWRKTAKAWQTSEKAKPKPRPTGQVNQTLNSLAELRPGIDYLAPGTAPDPEEPS